MRQDEFVVLMLPLVEQFGDRRPEQLARYFEVLNDIPPSSFGKAVLRCRMELDEFPSARQLRDRAEEFHRLKNAKDRLETALWRIDLARKRVGG